MADWEKRADWYIRISAQRNEIFRPATEMMLDMANIKAGYRVLDVAAGAGGQTLLAAERVGPNGYVLAIDHSSTMLNATTDAVRREGLTNVETRVMDAENLDLDADSFDAVICQSGLEAFPNPLKAIKGMRRVVKPGGKVAAIVYSTAEKNPYLGIPRAVVRSQGGTVEDLFKFGESQTFENAFRDTSLSDVAICTVSIRRHFSSAGEAIQRMRDGFFHHEEGTNLSDSQREQAWIEIEQQLRQFEGPNGVEVPGEFLIGAGTK